MHRRRAAEKGRAAVGVDNNRQKKTKKSEKSSFLLFFRVAFPVTVDFSHISRPGWNFFSFAGRFHGPSTVGALNKANQRKTRKESLAGWPTMMGIVGWSLPLPPPILTVFRQDALVSHPFRRFVGSFV